MLFAGRETDDLARAVSAVQQLRKRLTGGQPGIDDGEDLVCLSRAVTLAVKAASRLRKVFVNAAELSCSDGLAAALADSLEAAAGLMESAGGLKSAAGPYVHCRLCYTIPDMVDG